MTAYYNEIDPYAAQWLRNLIAAGHIAPGDVDERSIKDVRPDDLKSYTQCHFFAGIGVWSHALRLAGWPDDRPVWTGSCPCQPFSAAGKGAGVGDERHLWPAWFDLIRERRPVAVFGEQVEAAIRHSWLDLVQADMEGIGYAVAPVGIPAAGFGAPHIRQRLWFVADAAMCGRQHEPEIPGSNSPMDGKGESRKRACCDGDTSGLDNAFRDGRHQSRNDDAEYDRQQSDAAEHVGGVGKSTCDRSEVRQHVHGEMRGQGFAEGCNAGGVANDQHAGSSCARLKPQPQGAQQQSCHLDREESTTRPGPANGHWRDADWLHCRDGKWRPVEPGTFPLAHGATARVGRLRAYGNAIVPQVAAEVISAYMLG